MAQLLDWWVMTLSGLMMVIIVVAPVWLGFQGYERSIRWHIWWQ